MLTLIASRIISTNQNGFIKGRKLKYRICITSKTINILPKKVKGGIMEFKIDIKKKLLTLSLDFLIQVQQQFGSHQTFISWILQILQSSLLSIRFKGNLVGYFSCSRQGNPLSRMMFCLAKDALCRGISQVINYQKNALNGKFEKFLFSIP